MAASGVTEWLLAEWSSGCWLSGRVGASGVSDRVFEWVTKREKVGAEWLAE